MIYFWVFFPFLVLFDIKIISKGKIMSKKSQLTELKNSLINIKNSIITLDDSIAWVLIIDITETMVGIMLNIWTISLSDDSPIIKEHLEGFAFNTNTSSIKLVISCFINGLVHEESEQIYSVLIILIQEILMRMNIKNGLCLRIFLRKKCLALLLADLLLWEKQL